MLSIEPWLENWLLTQPEYRMGYQKVTATLSTGGTEHGVVLNGQIFLKGSEIPWQVIYWDWASVLAEARKSALRVTQAKLIPREPESLRGVRQIAVANEKFRTLAERKQTMATFSMGERRDRYLTESRELSVKAASAAAENAPITLTQEAEIFKRFSAYANDRRITAGRGLTQGTFATTKEDADANVKTGADAVARYALPDSKPASNVFTISPAKDSELQRGVVQPANRQPGGGVEVIFVNGLPDGTVTGPVTIPDK
jgi:hypothetical protein